MSVYVTGPNGRLGSQLVAMGAKPIYDDIVRPETVVPEDAIIINCAAVTDVDRCETEYGHALDVNGRSVDELARFYYPTRIIQISTDYIFAGKRGPYSENYFEFFRDGHEDDLVPNTCGYGFTKFVGECYGATWKNVHVVRTTGLYGGVSGKSDFVKLVVNQLSSGIPVKATRELHGNQTYIPHLAEALLMLCAKSSEIPKVLHIASKEVITRYEFALMIASVWGLDKTLLHPCKNSQVPGWVASRPTKGGLKTNLARKLGLPIYTILEGLQDAKRLW